MICDHIEARLEGGDKENWLYSGGSSKLCSNHSADRPFLNWKKKKEEREQVGVGKKRGQSLPFIMYLE